MGVYQNIGGVITVYYQPKTMHYLGGLPKNYQTKFMIHEQGTPQITQTKISFQ